MSRGYKMVKNGMGADFMIGLGKYVSVGVGVTDITIRGDGKSVNCLDKKLLFGFK